MYRIADRFLPRPRIVRHVLDPAVAREDGGRRACAPPGKARDAVGVVADEREEVRNRGRLDAELLDHSRLVEHAFARPIEAHDARAANALREIFVGRANEHLGDLRLRRRDRGCGRERVVGLAGSAVALLFGWMMVTYVP